MINYPLLKYNIKRSKEKVTNLKAEIFAPFYIVIK